MQGFVPDEVDEPNLIRAQARQVHANHLFNDLHQQA